MDKEQFRYRTKKFALNAIELIRSLPREHVADIISRQLIRSSTSVGANYRAACRAKSSADFISKMGTVEEEADESMYWIELLIESNIVPFEKVQPLYQEADEILAMTVSSIKPRKFVWLTRNLQYRKLIVIDEYVPVVGNAYSQKHNPQSVIANLQC